MSTQSDTKNKRIYLDHAATTPIDPRVLSAMQKTEKSIFGNPSSIHKEGVAAKREVESARKQVAENIGAQPDEVIFTSGGTESNNLAIFGMIASREGEAGRGWFPHIIVSSIEHTSILECARELEKRGAEVTYLPVGANGIVSVKSVSEAIKENTVLVSVMYANNEVGTIQPITEIAKAIRLKTIRQPADLKLKTRPLFHTDACQATNYLDMNVLRLGVDMMSFNASKIYGPKGVGALFVKRGIKLSPILFGGGQENGIRNGTENIAGIRGFAEAMNIAEKMKAKESARLMKLRDLFIKEVLHKIPGTVLNGDAEDRLPNNANFSFPDLDGEEIVIQLDARGIAASTGSACANISSDGKISHVLMAISGDKTFARGGVRFTLGRNTTKEDITRTIKELSVIIKNLRR
ncbi:MAG: cysteine desulfurase family protein [Candidatus Paceibacterota bacterium]|jgi:cysteine desulfurase|nr:cysteine desulfurase [Candidatus Paceibacterota bacterium]